MSCNSSPATGSSSALSPAAFKTNIHRNKTKRWVEAPKVDYGEGWGDDYDDDSDPDDDGRPDDGSSSRALPPTAVPPSAAASGASGAVAPKASPLPRRNSFDRGDDTALPRLGLGARSATWSLPPTPQQLEQRELLMASAPPPPPKIKLQSQFLSSALPRLASLGASSTTDRDSVPPPHSPASRDRIPLPLGPSSAAMPAASGPSRAGAHFPAPAAAPAVGLSLPRISIPDTPPLPPPDDAGLKAISARDGVLSDPSPPISKQPIGPESAVWC